MEFTLRDGFGADILARVDEVFHADNLLQMILHAHLLIERGLTNRIREKLARPEAFDEKTWTFHQKALLYIALYDPWSGEKQMLLGLNRLRNKIAHSFQDDLESCAAECLPFEDIYPPWARGRESRPDAFHQIGTVALNLLFTLGVIKGARRTDLS